ncbi:hypothetical protein [Caproiciproducens faecalis]|uniref:DUF4825 domain-containing protein n=1 Tax=Caproiciproducens faecalis TaxID=2820301 RepID=A0ABS7DNH7_9FIRM|nr:hypothetical protein [Caproiciproducens faecalis]MBW7572838.1 hypothetical protein [Caproiciproducens faecalis]
MELIMKRFYLILLLFVLFFILGLIYFQSSRLIPDDNLNHYGKPQDALSACFNKDTGFDSYSIIHQEQVNENELLFIEAVAIASEMSTNAGTKMKVFTAAVLHHDTKGFYVTKSIPCYDLENNSFTKISGDFTFKNKKVRYHVGRINDLSQDFTEEFKEMKEYNDHVFLSYQVDDLT